MKYRFLSIILCLGLFSGPAIQSVNADESTPPTDALLKGKKMEAISGTVTGNDQQVGFRAMIMKQAIEYNLAGSAKNLPNDVVNFTLQGHPKRLTAAVSAIQKGTKKSSNIKVSTTQGTIDPALSTFTIYAWTSTSRGITNPYDLVFRLRPDDGTLGPTDVNTEWHGILRSTLKGDDLNKLRPDD
jgi:acylphosphatase